MSPDHSPSSPFRRRWRRLLVAVPVALATLSVPAHGQVGGEGAVDELPGRALRTAAASQTAGAAELRLGPAAEGTRLRVDLGPLSAAERGRIEAARGAPFRELRPKRQRIGIHRLQEAGGVRRLEPSWQQVPGGLAAAVSVRSPEAAAIRIALRLRQLPAGIEVVFFSPGRADRRYGPHDAASLRGAGDGAATPALWSPVLPGDTAAFEVFLPGAVGPAPVIELVQVGHLFRSPLQVEAAAQSGSCNIDIACAPEWEELAKSVARIVIQGTSLCTGQLLATDNDDAGRVFLTAAHCVAGRPAAASLSFLWFFRRARCGAGEETMTQTYGGADLLTKTGVLGERPAATDHTLLRLRREPPDGVTLAGWSVRRSRRSNREAVTTVHHPSGDDKKVTTGQIRGRFNVFGAIDRSAPQTHHRTLWDSGTTEGGSSGSGLYVGEEWPEQYLIGVLSGGFASCQAPDEPDFYGAFHRAYRKMRRFLQ